MKLAIDTNILVRFLTRDHPAQAGAAQAILEEAELVALTLPALCELAWVLTSRYKSPRPDIARSIRTLIAASNVQVNRSAVDAGLRHLDGGGDFADGIIAHEGWRLGADEFASFDREAVRLARSHGQAARLIEAR